MGMLFCIPASRNIYIYIFRKMYSVALPQIQHVWAFWDRGPMGATSEHIFLIQIRGPKGENCVRFLFTILLGSCGFSTGTDSVGYIISFFFTIWPPTLDIGIPASIPTVGLKAVNTLRQHLG